MNKQTYKQSNEKNNKKKLIIIALSSAIILGIAFSIKVPGSPSSNNAEKNDFRAEEVVDGDIIIPVSEITETARFYPAKINGIELEAIAVKASDGSIRTAFNTCQVCYSSGRGYYVQDGEALVCQNCGNRFSMDEVEVTRGGCNPVPITEEYKTVNEESITISEDILVEAAVIFQNWK